ncbi:MAG: hypothetical protein ACK5CE_15640 [Actinomycetes bacterium]
MTRGPDPDPWSPEQRLVVRADGSVVCRVPARVGLVGNPSDGYGGAVLATVVPAFAAEVTASESSGVTIEGPGAPAAWPSLDEWRTSVCAHGHGDEQRIASASLAVLDDHLTARGRVDRTGVRIGWRTTVPRSVGLAGSSAIAVATIDAAAAVWGASLDRRVVAALALSAERDVLGIAAGWQDRVVQAEGRTVLVDTAAMEDDDGVTVPRVVPVGWPEPHGVELLLAWAAGAATSSDDYHAPLRRSADTLAAPMAELGALARTAADAWTAGDAAALATAMDTGWRLRQTHAPLRADHAALVESVRDHGLPATTPGSGGAVVAVCTDPAAVDRATAALSAAGHPVARWRTR